MRNLSFRSSKKGRGDREPTNSRRNVDPVRYVGLLEDHVKARFEGATLPADVADALRARRHEIMLITSGVGSMTVAQLAEDVDFVVEGVLNPETPRRYTPGSNRVRAVRDGARPLPR
jgi:hypothetical protein